MTIEGAQEAFAAVVGGGAADADDNPFAAKIEGCRDQDAETVGRRLFGIAFLGRKHREAAHLRHLDEGLAPFVEQQDRRHERPHQRIDRFDHDPFASTARGDRCPVGAGHDVRAIGGTFSWRAIGGAGAEGGLDHFHRAVAAVGHRQLHDLGLRAADHRAAHRRLQHIRYAGSRQ